MENNNSGRSDNQPKKDHKLDPTKGKSDQKKDGASKKRNNKWRKRPDDSDSVNKNKAKKDSLLRFVAPAELISDMVRVYGVSKDRAMEVFEEYKKFIYIKSSNSAVVSPIDINRMWRLHFTHTQSYLDLCQHIGNGIVKFEMTYSYPEGAHMFKYTLEQYTQNFGAPVSAVWSNYEQNHDIFVDGSKVFVIKKFWKK